jgi:hypothetical protein
MVGSKCNENGTLPFGCLYLFLGVRSGWVKTLKDYRNNFTRRRFDIFFLGNQSKSFKYL